MLSAIQSFKLTEAFHKTFFVKFLLRTYWALVRTRKWQIYARGGTPISKNDGGARRTFQGLKMRFWYLKGVQFQNDLSR